MKPKIAALLILICLISQSFLSSYRIPTVYPMYDSSGAVLPRNFRSTNSKMPNSSLNVNGLHIVKASGSGQFSEEGFSEMLHHLSLAPQNLVVVDLRQESHGFINGKAISWTDGNYNRANEHRSKIEVEADEYQRLRVAGEIQEIIINPIVQKAKLKVHSAKTERALVESRGAQYIRMPVTDLHRPSNEVVDQFVAYVKSLPADQWVHFHCRAGKGRTTTFMALMDMMKNGKSVAFKDIVARQKQIGGSDLASTEKQDAEKARTSKERYEFLKKFYLYCQSVPTFDISWSEWLSQEQALCVNP